VKRWHRHPTTTRTPETPDFPVLDAEATAGRAEWFQQFTPCRGGLERHAGQDPQPAPGIVSSATTPPATRRRSSSSSASRRQVAGLPAVRAVDPAVPAAAGAPPRGVGSTVVGILQNDPIADPFNAASSQVQRPGGVPHAGPVRPGPHVASVAGRGTLRLGRSTRSSRAPSTAGCGTYSSPTTTSPATYPDHHQGPRLGHGDLTSNPERKQVLISPEPSPRATLPAPRLAEEVTPAPSSRPASQQELRRPAPSTSEFRRDRRDLGSSAQRGGQDDLSMDHRANRPTT